MKYYVEVDGCVWAFEDDGSQDYRITPTMRAMTDGEVKEHINPPPTAEQLGAIEDQWRETEMPIAQQNVTAIEYGEGDIPGTTQEWQKYWLALRKWTNTNPSYPDSSKRPLAPT